LERDQSWSKINLKINLNINRFVKIYNKIWRMMETLHYFTTREWTFESKNAVKLWNGMSVEDKKV